MIRLGVFFQQVGTNGLLASSSAQNLEHGFRSEPGGPQQGTQFVFAV
jgi:hypothetical protein